MGGKRPSVWGIEGKGLKPATVLGPLRGMNWPKGVVRGVWDGVWQVLGTDPFYWKLGWEVSFSDRERPSDLKAHAELRTSHRSEGVGEV
jgi:hypothetical protein